MKTLKIALILTLALSGFAVAGSPARGIVGAVDAVPGATLLLPHFKVEISGDKGVTTLFSVNNASAAPVLAHVTFWTDLSVATLDFDLYLTGFDVVTVNLRDVFNNGSIPVTGPTVSNRGSFSFDNANFPGCDFPLPAQLPPSLLNHIRRAHVGLDSPDFFGGQCSGVSFGCTDPDDFDQHCVARGYITIDVANACSLAFPDSPGYFQDGGNGIAGNANVLWGDVFKLDPQGRFAHGDNLVHIEAIGSVDTGLPVPDAGFWSPNDYTFYGRYVGASAIDNREPLATTWATRFQLAAPFDGSKVTCWRDTGIAQSPFVCGGLPLPFPLGQRQVVIFDEEENPIELEDFPFSPPPTTDPVVPCPWESNHVEVADTDRFGVIPFDYGWIYLNLNTSTDGAFDPFKQSYVSQSHDASGLFSVGYPGIALDSALANINAGTAVPKTYGVTTAPNEVILPDSYCSNNPADPNFTPGCP